MNQTIRLITSLLAISFPFTLSAQNFTIGTNHGTNESATYPAPFGDFRESTRAQYLYKASEMTAAGAQAGNISKLGFFVENVDGVDVHENWTLKLLLTSSSSLINGTWQFGSTTVYGPVDYTPTVGLNQFALDAPFYWPGTNNANLVVEICHTANPTNGSTSSANALVQWTVNLPFNGSRTRALNNDADICTTAQTNENGIRTNRPVLHLSFCYPPDTLAVAGVTSTSADLSWTAPDGGAGAYDYTYGLAGYQPGVVGTQLGSGSTNQPNVSIFGLEGVETYTFWVRTDCGDGYSTWSGPLNFTTDPSCGDLFLDSGGPALPYDTSENYVKVLCSDIADNAVSLSFLGTFSTGAGDTLKIYNGNSTASPLLAALSGVYSPPLPGPYTSVTASGCLTVEFVSNNVKSAQDLGWFALLSCAPLDPGECYAVLELEANNITSTTADVSWLDMFGAESYQWELVELPYVGPQSVIQSDPAYGGTAISFDNLEAGTKYSFAVRTNCKNGSNSLWDTLVFTTPILCDGPLVQCSQTYTFSASKTGLWNINECGTASPGKERIFRFIAPHTRSYKFEVTAASGGFVNYFIKAENGNCDDTGWECIDDFNVPGGAPLPAIPGAVLTAGTLYYILADAQTTGTVMQTFRITECDVPNDAPANAVLIEVNDDCLTNIYSNLDASIDPGEPDPDADDSDGLTGRWLDGADETVWFKFQAPPSGTITIFTNPFGNHIPNDDTQVALYQVGDENDYTTYQLLVSDEDNGSSNLGFNSVVSYSGLVDGDFYYIQVDGWGTSTGAFCIGVFETAETVGQANCDADYSVTGVKEEKWYNIYATPDALDIGPLLAAINPHGLNLDTVLCRVQHYDELPYTTDDIPYLPIYYYLKSTKPFNGSVTLRLFFTDSQFAALKDSVNAPDKTIEDLIVTRFNGNVTDCSLLNNSGSYKKINPVTAVPMSGTFYVEFKTDSLGEFGGNLGQAVLPLQLKSFTGKVLDAHNLLEWTTLSEKNVQWHIVERSLNGLQWTELGRRAGQAFSTVPQSYSLEDRKPPAKAYYRLRSVDFDGTTAVSQAVLLTRRSEYFGVTGAFPSPTSGNLSVLFSVEAEEEVLVRLTDLVGRIALEQPVAAAKGANQVSLSLASLPAGIYCVIIATGNTVSEPLRVVKQ